jgi:hypothetical protein
MHGAEAGEAAPARSVARRCALLLALSASALLAPGCAWSNRANRPVWNAFEEHLVPEDDTAFYATLPLTVPAGVLSILADSFVVHPVQVMDDAWDDAGKPWRELDWQHDYYTELAVLPFRVIATPLIFVVSFLGRSLFDLPLGGAADPRAAQAKACALLERLAVRCESEDRHEALFEVDWSKWSPAVDQAWEHAMTHGPAASRLLLINLARSEDLPRFRADPLRGWNDPSAVVRHGMLDHLPEDVSVPPEIIEALRNDPEEAVRDLARRRWPADR